MEQRKAKIGVGIVTYNRSDYFKTALASVRKYLPFIDELVCYHDGPLPEGYESVWQNDWRFHRISDRNRGVAFAKNTLMRELMLHGCDYLFIMEDDMEILDRRAIVGYLAAHRMTNIPHLNFHGHGDNLYGPPLYSAGPLAYWPNAVGSWSFYTREILEQVGLMDEHFINAYEHVEHSWRIYRGKLDYGIWPDVIGSEMWIRAQAGALENSSIRDEDGNWHKRIKNALEYWKSIDPDCPANMPNWDAQR